jgi:hypothetical protein
MPVAAATTRLVIIVRISLGPLVTTAQNAVWGVELHTQP